MTRMKKIYCAFLSLWIVLICLTSCDPKHTCVAEGTEREKETAATCVAEGHYDLVARCSVCRNELSRTTETVEKQKAHIYENGKCRTCGATETIPDPKGYLRCKQNGDADPNGAYVLFGEYPQTVKADNVTVTDVQDFRGYYLGSDGYFYAAVKAEPFLGGYTFTTGTNIEKSSVYYFKVEPIRWRIYLENEHGASILCDSIIDSKAYQSSYKFDSEAGVYYATVSDAPAETFQNNYAYSEVRAWLNAQFYEIAFSDLQRSAIIATTVSNGVSTTGYPTNPYVCENTEDFVFLPAHLVVTKSAYGFSAVAYNRDEARQMQTSDYARANGAYMQTNEADYGMGSWWLRSPYYEYSNHVREVRSGGDASYRNSARAEAENGVVPALKLRLQ